MATKGNMLYEGKAKRVYVTDDPNLYIVEYKDDATAFNGQKKGEIAGKGQLNNAISTIFMNMLKDRGIPTHFVDKLNDREQLVKKVDIVMLEVVVRNIAAGTLAKRIGLSEGTVLPKPVVEFYYKNDDLGDPLINEWHIEVLNLATPETVKQLAQYGLQINEILVEYLKNRGIKLVDFKLEFGITPQGELILADEISPDTCRFWDADTNEKLDKDRFRRDLGNVEEAYQEMLRRLGGVEA